MVDVFEKIEKEIETDIARMTEETDRFFRWAQKAAKRKPGPHGPFVWGYSYTESPDGEPKIERFGNVPGRGSAVEPFAVTAFDERAGSVHVTADLPGVDKEAIDVAVDDDEVSIRATGRGRSYEKHLKLPAAASGEGVKATYRDGVLEMTLPVSRETHAAPKHIRVE